MPAAPLDSILDIRQHARGALSAAGALDVSYVPLERVSAAVDLQQADLFELGADAPQSMRKAVARLRSSVLGMLAVKQKTIYVDPDLDPGRKRFTIAHEIGHKVLPWQDDSFHADDKYTLASDTRAEFEREANAFAGELLFGAGRFNEQADAEAPGIAVPLALANEYGTSAAAALRQYVEASDRPVALLAVSRFLTRFADGESRLGFIPGQCVTSPSFVSKYGVLSDVVPRGGIDATEPLFHTLEDLSRGVGDSTSIVLDTKRGSTTFAADTFCNGRLRFVLLFRRSRFAGQTRVLTDTGGKPLSRRV